MTNTPFDDFELTMQSDELADTDLFFNEPDDSMDGDNESALASAGMGTDESYCHDNYDNETPYGIELDGGNNEF